VLACIMIKGTEIFQRSTIAEGVLILHTHTSDMFTSIACKSQANV